MNYPQLEEAKMEFPKGIEVNFFSNTGKTESHLRANQAIRYTNSALWKAKGRVIVVNSKGEKLETESLNWDENKELIFSDEFVKLSTGKQIITGIGFKANQL